MEDIIMESVENLNGNDVSQKIMSCKGGHDGDENQQVSTKVLPKLFYPREMLIKLKNHPNSKEKPAVFDDVDRVSKNGMWDPEHWHSRTAKDPKRSTSGSAVGAGNKEDQQDKKRGKDEGDEFCFTPQRRSFVSGCHVAPSRRQEAEPALPAIVNESVRESTLPARRVGSGRLTGRDVEPAPVKEPRDRREPLRAPGPQRERTFERSDREPQRNERGGERNDRHDRTERNDRSERNGRTFPTRSDPRDKDPSEKDRRNYDRSGYDRDYSGRGDRYNSRRKNEDDTPEWFFGGPSSQHDTIELRGFDEEKDRKQTGKAPVKKESAKERQSAGGSKKSEEGMVNGSSRPGSGLSGKVSKEEQSAITEAPRRKSPTNQNQMDFNIEDFLKMDGDLNGLGLGQTESEETSRGSKASRWFGKTTEVPEASKPVVSENVKQDLSTNQDAARSLLEMLQKGGQQQSVEHKKVVTAEELERSSGKFSNNERSGDDGMTVFNKLLAQVQETTSKPHSVMNSAPTEQDILANLLGKQMKIDAQPSQQNHPGQHHAQQNQQQDALSKFLQQQQNNQMHHQNKQHPNNQMMHQNLQQHTNNHQQQAHHPFSMHGDQQQHSDVHALMRDVANGLLTQHPQTLNQLHLMAMQQQQQQHHQQQQHQQLQHQQQLQQQQHQQLQQQQQQQLQQQQQQQRQAFVGSPQQSSAKQSASSSSPLSFTPTAVMRKMTAEKDKAKVASLDKNDGVEPGMSATSSPPANQGSSTSNRLTGRTASQVQGATRVSNQMRMNDVPVVQQQQQQQQQLLTGRPLVKGQEGILPFQQQPQQVGNRPFGLASASNAAITGVAVKMLEQQQQHQLLAAAVAASATQTQQQLKQQILQQQQQQQRTSPLQQSLLAYAGGLQTNMALQNRGIPNNVPVGNRTHFRPIHPQPMIPPISGYSPYMANQASLPAGQNRLPNSMGSSNQFYGVSSANNIRGSAQSLNALAALQQQAFGGNRSPNMLQGGNPLSRWFPPEILSQAGSGQMPTLPPMPNQKILSLEELERLHTSPMSH